MRRQDGNIYDVSTFIVTDEDVIHLDEYEGGHARFIMLTNECLNREYGNDDTIFVSPYWFDYVGTRFVRDEVMRIRKGDKRKPYQETSVWYGVEYAYLYFTADNQSISTLPHYNAAAAQDFHGLRNSRMWLSEADRLLSHHKASVYKDFYKPKITAIDQYMPVMTAAYKAIQVFHDKTLHGFLPALGQMLVITNNRIALNTAISRIFGIDNPINGDDYRLFPTHSFDYAMMDGEWWTSTCDSNGYVYPVNAAHETTMTCMDGYQGGDRINRLTFLPIFPVIL